MEVNHLLESQDFKVRIGNIHPGRNPRTYFDPVEMASLEASVAAQGVHTPILLRPMQEPGHYQIVAGERRFRAAKAVFGADGEIPARVKPMTDEEADAAALTENIERAAMTHVEEAEAAARVLGNCQGNRDEAAKRMGWSRSTLDKRLSLMYATDNVRKALQEGKIMLGHAELLAVCRKESQDATIEILLKQDKMMTVAELKAHIDKAALDLDKAIFSKEDCAACVHNSGNQSALFAEAISGGRCTNKACFEAKTEADLELRAKALREDYQVVRIARPGENHTLITLVAEGAKGVGAEQAQACRVCKNFGAVVSALPDKLGVTYKNVCMDVPCNTTMVAKRVEAEKAALAASQPSPQGEKPSGSEGSPEQGSQSAATKGGTNSPGKGKAEAAPTY